MSRREILATPYAEFIDLILCEAIYNGTAQEKNNEQNGTNTRSLQLWEAVRIR